MITINKTYAVLHAHDTYGSIGDSILKIPDYIKKAKELKIKSLALTNHGSMSTFVTFYEECRKNDINPLIGCEVYLADDKMVQEKTILRDNSHLILLAKNYRGLGSLIKIHNDAQQNGFYYKPRTDLKTLKAYAHDIICLSACVSGPLNKAYLKSDENKMMQIIIALKQIFRDDFYLEIQPGRFQEQISYNDLLVLLSQKLNIKLVATNDIHYLNVQDAAIHDYHVKDGFKVYNRTGFLYPDNIYYLMSQEELNKSFSRTKILTDEIIDSAIENTNGVAAKCNLIIPEEHHMPRYSTDIDEDKRLKDLCYQALEKYFPDQDKYKERLDCELDVIKTLGFSGYFLIVKDFVDFCDKNNIARGPGRGSGAGSIVSFLLGISIADPIRYNLMFERFLSVHRKSMPDIDLDIAPSGREKLYQHIIERYGVDHCCFVSTYNIRKARNAIKSAGRLLGYSLAVTDYVAKTVPYVNYDDSGDKHTNLTLRDAFAWIPDFRICARQYPDLVSLADKLENYPSSMGIHPAGIVISPVAINDKYPLVRCKNEQLMATSLDLKDVEKLSGVKFDLLSLSSLEVINNTLQDIGIKFNYADEKLLQDQKVWAMIGSDKTSGLFQISSYTYKTRMPQLKPKRIAELAACLALVRGPCISSGADKEYIAVLKGEKKPQYIHAIYHNVTKDTCGIVIYQEQILRLCMDVGLDSEEAYNLMKAVAKKKMDKITRYQEQFAAAALAKGMTQDNVKQIWQIILNAGLYAFNIAHATSYALLCYCSAYLKTYYPLHYMKNLLTKEYANRSCNVSPINAILKDCEEMRLKILPPDINKSRWEFTVEDNAIRMGFCAVKGIGLNAYEEVKKAAPITGLKDLLEKVPGRIVNKRTILLLIAAGVFSSVTNKSITELACDFMDTFRKEDWDGTVKIGSSSQILNLKTCNETQRQMFLYDTQPFLERSAI